MCSLHDIHDQPSAINVNMQPTAKFYGARSCISLRSLLLGRITVLAHPPITI